MTSIGRSSAALASGTLVSRVLGFVNIVVLAQAIGVVGAGANSFQVANQLPNTIYGIIAGGVLNAVLVPQIVRAGMHQDGGHGYINKLLTLAAVILAAATVVATLFAPVFVRISASGWDENQLHLATALAYWCLPQIFFYGLYTVLGEVLNARSSFGPFAWAPALNNVVAIAGFSVFMAAFGTDNLGHRLVDQWDGSMVTVLGATATLGIAIQALVLLVFWRRIGLRYRPDFHWRGVGLGTAGRIAAWSFGMIVVTFLMGLVSNNVASTASGQDASIAVLAKAWLVFMLPYSIVTYSIGTVYFTRMSEHGQAGRIADLKQDLSNAIRIISPLIVLAAAILIVVAFPFSRLLVSDWHQLQAFGYVIIALVLGMIPMNMLFMLQRTYFALSDTRTPFFFTLFQGLLFTALALICLLLPSDRIAIGLALADSVACTAEFFLAAYLLRRKIGAFGARQIMVSLLRFAAAAVPTLVVGWFLLVLLGGTHEGGLGVDSRFGAIVVVASVSCGMTVVYLVMLRLLRAPEATEAVRLVTTRFRRR